jgi:hypothetical protein
MAAPKHVTCLLGIFREHGANDVLTLTGGATTRATAPQGNHPATEIGV